MTEDVLDNAFEAQKNFSNKFFDASELSESEKEEKTKEFALALHSEVSSLIQGINFKGHTQKHDVSKSKIVYEGIDVFRYLLAIMNLWEVSPDEFMSHFWSKDNFLKMRHDHDQNVWSGQPVVIVDIDDVIAEFRKSFVSWLSEIGVNVDEQSPEYFFTEAFKHLGISSSTVFDEFISKRRLLDLKKNVKMINTVNELYRTGFWVHLLTARPEENMTCRYDTYSWLKQSGVKFHKVSFSPEKFLWLSKTEYQTSGKVVCAIDDSEKHALEYAKHHIKVFCPTKSYNQGCVGVENITFYDDCDVLLGQIESLYKSLDKS